MGSFRFPPMTSLPLQQALAEIPAHMRSQLEEGFRTIAALDRSQIDALARTVADHIGALGEVDTDQLASELGLDEDSLSSAITATSMTVAFISSWKETPDELVSGLIKASFLRDTDRSTLTHFVETISSKRTEIKKALNLRSLAEETLPAFRDFDTSIDMRLDFRKDQIETAVPVLLVHLRTDLPQERLFFQMTKSDVQQLVEQLKRTLLQLESAEKWATERAQKGN
jgi:hypothetical protein